MWVAWLMSESLAPVTRAPLVSWMSTSRPAVSDDCATAGAASRPNTMAREQKNCEAKRMNSRVFLVYKKAAGARADENCAEGSGFASGDEWKVTLERR